MTFVFFSKDSLNTKPYFKTTKNINIKGYNQDVKSKALDHPKLSTYTSMEQT